MAGATPSLLALLTLGLSALVLAPRDAGAAGGKHYPHNRDPICTGARATPAILWPPNHKFVLVSITGVRDPDRDPVQIKITAVTQDEPVDGLGDGDTAPDAVILHGGKVKIRAERSGRGNGRVYKIYFTAWDGKGGDCSGWVSVVVPHDKSPRHPVINDGQRYDSTWCRSCGKHDKDDKDDKHHEHPKDHKGW
jgi:hypothetical protein